MIRHWTTLAALVGELRPQLERAVIVECYRTSGDEFGIHIETPHGAMQLVLAMGPPIQSVYIQRANPPQKRQRMFLQLALSHVESIAIADASRILSLLVGQWELVIVAIPGARSNCILRDRASRVLVDAARFDPSMRVGMVWEPPPPHLPSPLECPEEWTVLDVLQRSRLLLAQPYAQAWCRTQNERGDTLWGKLSAEERHRIIASARAFRDELIERPRPVIARSSTGQEQFLLDCVPDGWQWHDVPSVEEGIRYRVRAMYQQWALERARHALEHRIQSELGRLERAIDALANDLERSEAAPLLEHWGNLLIVSPDRHRRGLASIECTDWDGTVYDVPLDPTQTVLWNAERYFAQARKHRRAAMIAEQRLPLLEQRADALRTARDTLALAQTTAQVESLARELFPASEEPNERPMPTQRAGRFRRVALPHGYVLLIGKDARSNDELTFRIAKPHDVWLHARGVEGAHGIIPLPSRQLPPPSVIERAAAVVAYHSAARGSSYVPVSWTQRKYLRKPKKSGAGAVDLLREWVVFVEPLNPSSHSESEC
jgi:predicted ribosome quality control (RQC) complex YloA/Tae2 family protein